MRRIRVGITVGDPAGIGPEIVDKARFDPRVTEVCEAVIFEPESLDGIHPGEESAAGGRAAYDVLVRATKAALAGDIDAIATALARLSDFAAANADRVASVEINPYLALPAGGRAVDALILPAAPSH